MKLRNTIALVATASLFTTVYADFDKTNFIADVKTGDVPEVVKTYLKAESSDSVNVATIVKHSIIESEASTTDVANIVRVAIVALPESARVIYTAALAVAPDAHDEVLKVYYELTSNKGTGYSDAKGVDLSKGGKGGKGGGDDTQTGGESPVVQNPLDFPSGAFANNEVGSLTGGAEGGAPFLRGVEAFQTVVTNPPVNTDVEEVDSVSTF